MICLDTCFVIDLLKGKREAIEALTKYSVNDRVVTTEITVFEVFYGIYMKKQISEKEKFSAKEFFNTLQIFPFGKGCGERSAQVSALLGRAGSSIEKSDIFIASIMAENGCGKILTKNIKHFSQIKDIEVIAY